MRAIALRGILVRHGAEPARDGLREARCAVFPELPYGILRLRLPAAGRYHPPYDGRKSRDCRRLQGG